MLPGAVLLKFEGRSDEGRSDADLLDVLIRKSLLIRVALLLVAWQDVAITVAEPERRVLVDVESMCPGNVPPLSLLSTLCLF